MLQIRDKILATFLATTVTITCAQPVTADFVERGTIATALGKACIASSDYGQSVLGNPAALSGIDTFDVIYNGTTNSPKTTLGGIFYKAARGMVVGYSLASYDYAADKNIEVYKNNFSLAKQFSDIASLGVTFCTYGLDEDRFQQEGVEAGIIVNRWKTTKVGLLFKSGTTLFTKNDQMLDLPLQAGIGGAYQFKIKGPAGDCNKWELRLDYLFIDNMRTPVVSREIHEMQFGIKRGLVLMPFYCEKETGVPAVRLAAEIADRLLPSCFGVNAGFEHHDIMHHFYEVSFGWSDILLLGNPGKLNCRFDAAVVASKKQTKIWIGSDVGFRP